MNDLFKCSLDISNYKPTQKITDKIKKVCEEYSITYCISAKKEEFFKQMSSLGNTDIEQSYKTCISNKCHFLRDGKIAVCSMPLLIDKFNNVFSGNFKVVPRDTIDLYDELLNSWKVLENLESPIPMCRYCKEYSVKFEWDVADKIPNKIDRLVD